MVAIRLLIKLMADFIFISLFRILPATGMGVVAEVKEVKPECHSKDW